MPSTVWGPIHAVNPHGQLALHGPANQTGSTVTEHNESNCPYRLERLPVVQAFHWRSRSKPALKEGELVYYGPMPVSYGIGEVQGVTNNLVAVDFRGTGTAGIHEDLIHENYLIPISESALSSL